MYRFRFKYYLKNDRNFSVKITLYLTKTVGMQQGVDIPKWFQISYTLAPLAPS